MPAMENQGFVVNQAPVQGGHESARSQFPDINSNEASLVSDMQNLGTQYSSAMEELQRNNARDNFPDPMMSYSSEKPGVPAQRFSNTNLPDTAMSFPSEKPGVPAQRFSNTNLPDPMMRQSYAYTMPPAGLVPRQHHDQTGPNRKYNMASDIFGTGMDKSWASESPPKQRDLQTPARAQGSFKITEFPLNPTACGGMDDISDPSQNPTAGRRARESLGNPLTGQGYHDSSTKTAKRYFEGSNANQKLW